MGAAHLIDPPLPEERLYSSCLFCAHRFPQNSMFGRLPPGLQLAYDPVRARLWSICGRCRRWNLIPADERFDAIDLLERTVSGRALLLARSDNIELYGHDELQIVRIGGARLVERVSWRYGSHAEQLTGAAPSHRGSDFIATTAVGAVERLNTMPGFRYLARRLDADRALDLVRWSRFGSVVWDGRVPCPDCRSVLHALHFDVSWWLYPRIQNGRLVVGVPCTRCDPWTPSKVFDLHGDDAHLVLRRVLAYQQVGGSRDRTARAAADIVQQAGSADRLLQQMSTGRSSLWRLGTERRIALAIALDHIAEKRLIQVRLEGIESEWRVEEELARIIDDELS